MGSQPGRVIASLRKELAGRRFGRLTVIARCAHDPNYWRCRCDCGGGRTIFRGSLTRGATQSCGCLGAERSADAHRTHGLSHTEEYGVWAGIKRRCYRTTDPFFKNYGGRGIVVCERWRDDFAAFLADMGPRPSAAHSIERSDNDGPYSPSNCAWIPRRDQSKNRRGLHRLTFNGETLTIADWTRRLKFANRLIILKRLQRGWSVDRALTVPVRESRP